MPVYRGLMLNERVDIYRATKTDDGMCGDFPEYSDDPIITRYLCRIWFPSTEKTSEDMGSERIGLWSMLGSKADIREGDKVKRTSHGDQEFIVTEVRKPLDGRVQHHQRHTMRRVRGTSSSY